MDINPGGNDEDEEEMLDEDEIKERKANMLKELIEKIEREEGGSANMWNININKSTTYKY